MRWPSASLNGLYGRPGRSSWSFAHLTIRDISSAFDHIDGPAAMCEWPDQFALVSAAMSRLCFAFVAALAACSGSDASIDDYLPKLPAAPGGLQVASAGEVTDAHQLVTGPAQSGLVGDFF